MPHRSCRTRRTRGTRGTCRIRRIRRTHRACRPPAAQQRRLHSRARWLHMAYGKGQ